MTTRHGVRSARPTVVMHALRGDEVSCGQIGLVVSRKVGNAVVRNRVKRRLRHMSRELLEHSDQPTWVVIRALPLSASDPARVRDDVWSAWRNCLAHWEAAV